MGRAFEFRKGRKMKRWSAMAKAFTKIGREIAMAAKTGGPNPDTNPRLRVALQNAKGASMPKDRVEAAIKRATSKEEKDYEEVLYEGYGPHGVALMIETATDNPVRTVANLRMYLSRSNGSLGTSGSVGFMFERKGVFTIEITEQTNMDDLEMELIDAGAEDVQMMDEEVIALCDFTDFGSMSKALEEKGIHVKQAELQRFPLSMKEITPEQEADMDKLMDKFDEDDDITNVFHNMAFKEEE